MNSLTNLIRYIFPTMPLNHLFHKVTYQRIRNEQFTQNKENPLPKTLEIRNSSR